MRRRHASIDANAGPQNADVHVLGGGPTGVAVVERLRGDGRDAVLVDETHAPSTAPVRRAGPTALEGAGIDGTSTLVVATPSDSRNLLVAQLAAVRFDVDRVVVRTNDPSRRDAITDAGHESVCATTALANALVDRA